VPPPAPWGALHDPPRQRKRRELLRGVADESPRFDLGDEVGKLVTLGLTQVAPPPVTLAQELHDAAPLVRLELSDVVMGQERDLRGREKPSHGDRSQYWNVL
jgi:hypothetical protein